MKLQLNVKRLENPDFLSLKKWMAVEDRNKPEFWHTSVFHS
jgi:hypothetical protein